MGSRREVGFECVHCAHRAVAYAVAGGEAQRSTSFLESTFVARQGAAEGAVARAVVEIHTLAALARCPKCGRRDERLVLKTRLRALLYLLALPPVALFGLLCLMARSPRLNIFGLGAAAALFVAVLFRAYRVFTLPGDAASGVMFLKRDVLRAPSLRGVTCAACQRPLAADGDGARCIGCNVTLHHTCMRAHTCPKPSPDPGAA